MCLTVNHRYNKIEDQLDATIEIYRSSKQLNMFRTIPCPSSGAQDCDLRIVRAASLRTSDRQPGDSAVNHSLVLLMKGRELSEIF